MSQEDHDLLTKIDANLSNFMDNFKDHVLDDKKYWDKVELQQKVTWGVAGVVIFIEIVGKFIK